MLTRNSNSSLWHIFGIIPVSGLSLFNKSYDNSIFSLSTNFSYRSIFNAMLRFFVLFFFKKMTENSSRESILKILFRFVNMYTSYKSLFFVISLKKALYTGILRSDDLTINPIIPLLQTTFRHNSVKIAYVFNSPQLDLQKHSSFFINRFAFS